MELRSSLIAKKSLGNVRVVVNWSVAITEFVSIVV
jgi:hypothetical protein